MVPVRCRRALVAGSLFLAGLPWSHGQSTGGQSALEPAPAAFPSGTDTPLGARVAALLADAAVSREHWGVAVMTMDGTPLYGLDEGKLFRPASTAKLFTTAAAMALLGPEATVTTDISFPPPAANGTVRGDLTIVGRGDANLSCRTVPYAGSAAAKPPADTLCAIDSLAASVAKAGVRHITGNVIGSNWPWEPYPQGWGTDDLLWGYGAPVSSLAVDDNEVLLTVTPGAVDETAGATLSPDVGYYRIGHTFLRTHSADTPASIAVYREPGERSIRVVGSVAAAHPYTTWLAVDDPPLYAAFALLAKLREHGITVDGKAQAPHEQSGNPDNFLQESHKPLTPTPMGHGSGIILPCQHCYPPPVQRTSAPLADDVTITLKESQNLHAEMMLRRLALGDGRAMAMIMGASAFAQGARVVRQWLIDAGLDGKDFVFYDGSGLSVKDMVTPRAEAQLLAFAAKQPWFAQWKAALPVGGVDGTLAGRFKKAPGVSPDVARLKGHVFAKTGTLGESRALAGYVECASGRTVIFSVLVDNHLPGTSADREAMDKIVAAIAETQ